MKICPLCHQPVADAKGPKKICYLCGKPIKRRHKWHFGLLMRPEHYLCDQPEQYERQQLPVVATVHQGKLEDASDRVLPTIEEMSGSIKGITEGKPVKEYLEHIADE